VRFLLVIDLNTQRTIFDWSAEDCRFDHVVTLSGRPEPETIRSVADVEDAAGDRDAPLRIHHRHLIRNRNQINNQKRKREKEQERKKERKNLDGIPAFLLGGSVVVDCIDDAADAVVGAAASSRMASGVRSTQPQVAQARKRRAASRAPQGADQIVQLLL